MYVSGIFPEKEQRLSLKSNWNADTLISILKWCWFWGYKAGPVLSNEHGVANFPLLHSAWQETVLEDYLFTRQEVIASLDLLVQARKYKGWFLEITEGKQTISHHWKHPWWAQHGVYLLGSTTRPEILWAEWWVGRMCLCFVTLEKNYWISWEMAAEQGCLWTIDVFFSS